MGFNLPRRTKKRLPRIIKELLIAPQKPNTMWALDFMYDTPYYGRPLRTLNVIDESNQEVLTIEINLSLPDAMKYSMPIFLNHSSKYQTLLKNGSKATTKIVLMQHSGSCHRYTINNNQKIDFRSVYFLGGRSLQLERS